MTKDYLKSFLNPQFISKPTKEKTSMKCIKRGTLPENRVWSGECNNCNSVFEALEGELKNIQNDHRENMRMAYEECEVCKSHFWLYPKHQPPNGIL